MFVKGDTHSLLIELDVCEAQICELEKVSGYTIEDLIELFKNRQIVILTPETH